MEVQKRYAWMTFLSSNNYYIYMLLGLYKNLLDTKTKYPIYCGVTKEVSHDTRAILQKVGLKLIDLDTTVFSDKVIANSQQCCKHYAAAFTKLALLDTNIEKQFDKIVYIDTDVQVLANMDDLFDKPHMSAVADCAPALNKTANKYTVGCSIFCSGLFVWDFESNPGKGHEIISKLDQLDMKIKWHDQNVLNFFYSDWANKLELHLDPTYNLMNNPQHWNMIKTSVKSIHYVRRLREGWPFTSKINVKTEKWKSMHHFKEWITNLSMTAIYFNKNYGLSLPVLHYNNINYMSPVQSKTVKADGRSNAYLYF